MPRTSIQIEDVRWTLTPLERYARYYPVKPGHPLARHATKATQVAHFFCPGGNLSWAHRELRFAPEPVFDDLDGGKGTNARKRRIMTGLGIRRQIRVLRARLALVLGEHVKGIGWEDQEFLATLKDSFEFAVWTHVTYRFVVAVPRLSREQRQADPTAGLAGTYFVIALPVSVELRVNILKSCDGVMVPRSLSFPEPTVLKEKVRPLLEEGAAWEKIRDLEQAEDGEPAAPPVDGRLPEAGYRDVTPPDIDLPPIPSTPDSPEDPPEPEDSSFDPVSPDDQAYYRALFKKHIRRGDGSTDTTT